MRDICTKTGVLCIINQNQSYQVYTFASHFSSKKLRSNKGSELIVVVHWVLLKNS